MFEKPIVVDGRGHLIGRLASIVAKELLCGQKVVVTRCEQLEGSGSLFRAQVRFQQFLNIGTAHGDSGAFRVMQGC